MGVDVSASVAERGDRVEVLGFDGFEEKLGLVGKAGAASRHFDRLDMAAERDARERLQKAIKHEER